MAVSLEQIRQLADRVAASHRLQIVEIEFKGSGKQRLLRIFIEKDREERARLAADAQRSDGAEAGGNEASRVQQSVALDRLAWVTHEDCERFSRDFGTVLDVEDLVPGSPYQLEVSSPGLDRKLTSRSDYERFMGSLVKVQTFVPVAASRRWQGRLTGVNAGGLILDPTALQQGPGKKRAGVEQQALEIAFSNVEKASLVPEF